MLIGSDYYWKFVPGESIRGWKGPVAVGTTLGWVLPGPAKPIACPGLTVSLMPTHTCTLQVGGIMNRELDTTLRSFWDLESLGIQVPNNNPVPDQFSSARG